MEWNEEFCPNCGSTDICYHCNRCNEYFQNGVQANASLTPLIGETDKGGAVMEEKERYIVLSDRQIKNTTNNSQSFLSENQICDLLNQQDKRIKELEEENCKLKRRLTLTTKYKDDVKDDRNKLFEENKQLKQQLHDLPKQIVDEIKENNIYLNSSKPNRKDHIYDSYLIEAKILDTILKKYGGENE